MNAEDPLFILYTSGSTGKPKGVLHTTGGYLVYASMTHQYVFDYHDGDIYWCTADVGWVTGHSYIVYGPLANGATTLMFEGVPNYPTMSRFWEVIDKHKVNIFYTAPTAIRALMRAGDDAGEEDLAQVAAAARLGRRADQSGSLGVVSPRRRRRPLPDRRHLVADRDRRHPDHAAARRDAARSPARRRSRSSACSPQIVDAEGKVLEGAASGNLCIADSWPGQMRTVYGDHQRFVDTYFKTYPGQVLHRRRLPPRRGRLLLDHRPRRRRDQRRRPPHRHRRGRERAGRASEGVGGRRRRLSARHQGPGHLRLCHADGRASSRPRSCARSWSRWVRKEIGPIASPDLIQFAPGLPKTRSGKIMRRILRKIAEDEYGNARRHLDARRSGRGRRPGEQPAEPQERVSVRPRHRARSERLIAGQRARRRAWRLRARRDASRSQCDPRLSSRTVAVARAAQLPDY